MSVTETVSMVEEALEPLTNSLQNNRRQQDFATRDLRAQIAEIESEFIGRRYEMMRETFSALPDEIVEAIDRLCIEPQLVKPGAKLTCIKAYRDDFYLHFGFRPLLKWTKRRVDLAFAKEGL